MFGGVAALNLKMRPFFFFFFLEAKDLNQHLAPRETKQMVLILTNCCEASGLLPSGSFINWDIMRR